jgi:hypothetical protein
MRPHSSIGESTVVLTRSMAVRVCLGLLGSGCVIHTPLIAPDGCCDSVGRAPGLLLVAADVTRGSRPEQRVPGSLWGAGAWPVLKPLPFTDCSSDG